MNYNYDWRLADATFAKNKGTVFSCFACAGGSTMGYKLAGFDVIGCNEIDPKLFECYTTNHKPKHAYLQPIQDFKNRIDLPAELYNLDILDGSPPCSSFSMAGNRSKDWGKEKKFREGQKKQILDTLFFDFIDLAHTLQPKIVIAENVKGLLLGPARNYVKKIYTAFDNAGYYVQHYLLKGEQMGVAQKRHRCFFVAMRKDLATMFKNTVDMFNRTPPLDLTFNVPPIPFGAIYDGQGKPISEYLLQYWQQRKPNHASIADTKISIGHSATDFTTKYAYPNKILYTLTAKGYGGTVLYDKPVYISLGEFMRASTWPVDFNFCNANPFYVMGMSVPPVMTAHLATRIYQQWLTIINQ